MTGKPHNTEYPARFEAYIGLTTNDNVIDLLRSDRAKVHYFFESIAPEKIDYRYAEGKWSIKEILMHINYVERIMQYRALAASRGDEQTQLLPINHDTYFANAETEKFTIPELLDEFNTIRNYTIEFFSGLSQKQLSLCCGTGEDAISARAVGYALAGHARHHIITIKERYL
jgi:hypothetical protein